MKPTTDRYTRRTVLKTLGVSAAGSVAYTGAVAGRNNAELLSVDPQSIELETGETADVEVAIQGPPFGRTDVSVAGVPADPAEFRLSGRGATETVTLGPVEESGTAEFTATLPRGDEQVVGVEVAVTPPVGENEVLNERTGETFESITAGVEAAESGDSLLVGPGTYEETFEVTSDDLTITGVGDVTVTSDYLEAADPPEATIVIGWDATNVTISNITAEFEANPQGGNLADDNVIGIYGGDATLQNMVIDGVSDPSPVHQAGVLLINADVSISDSTIRNTAVGLDAQNGQYDTSNVTFENVDTEIRE